MDASTLAGIQYDGVRRAGYWLYERHPTLAPSLQSVFVPAAECLHVFRPVSPGAERGVPWLAAVLLALRELAEYLEAALVRAKIAGAVLRRMSRRRTAATRCRRIRRADFGAGLYGSSFSRARPSNSRKPPDAGPTFDPFVRNVLRKIASGAGLPL